MVDGVTLRSAVSADLDELVRLRRMMFEGMGYSDPARLDATDAAAAAYWAEALPSGQFHGWLAIDASGQAVGSGGVVIDRHPPGPGNLSGKIGYVMNLVTDPRYRRRGIARWIMQTMIAWLAARDVHVIALHASEEGRLLYEGLGFRASNEMRLRLDRAGAR